MALGLLTLAFLRLYASPDPIAKIPVPVRTQEVRSEMHPVRVSYLGRVAAESLLYASYERGGRLAEIPVEEGEVVEAGDPLALLDRADLADERARAEANYRAAKANYESALSGTRSETLRALIARLDKAKNALDYAEDQLAKSRTLHEAGALSTDALEQATLQRDLAQADYNAVRAQYDEAQAGTESGQIEAARQQMLAAKSAYDQVARKYDEAQLTAPFAGVVLDVRGNPGDVIGGGVPVVILRRKETLVDLGITAKDLDRLEEGMAATVDDRIAGTLHRLIDVPDPAHGLYRAEVRLEEERFHVGEVVRVDLTVDQVTGFRLPITALVDRGITGVYTVHDNRARFQPLDIVATRGEEVIVSGLSDGDAVVIENMTRLSEHDTVEVQ